MKYLVTFWTTTAAFRAEKAVEEKVVNFDYKLVAVPVELAETCHGYGLLVSSSSEDVLGEAESVLRGAGVEWKAEWEMSVPYKKLERNGQNAGK